MSQPTREDLELYVMGGYDGDVDELEAFLAGDAEARDIVADEAQLELTMREVANAATFCPACDDVVRDQRCNSCGAAVSAGGFAIEDVLVQNAHGRLYLARDADGKRVALKELAFVQSPGPEAFSAFDRETKFLRALEHPAIPRFVASFQEGKGVHARFYLAQEYIEGMPLDRRLADHWFDEAEIIGIAREVLEVLVYLQKLSPMIVHRDIKPANLVQRDDGSISVVDFGAAYDQGETVGSTAIGTFGYMPLEQMAGEVDASTDPYALGASLFHLLTRREPWKVLESPALGTANVSPGLRGFLHKLIARERKDRFASAAEALEALAMVERGETLDLAMVPVDGSRRHRRRWLPFVAAAAISVVGGGVGAYLVVDDDAPAVQQKAASAANTALSDAVVSSYRRFDTMKTLAQKASIRARAEARAERHPELPAGENIDLDFRDAEIHEVLRFIADVGEVNLVVPDEIRGLITVQLKAVPWDQALEVILEAEGLWYRYRPSAKLIRVASRRQLDLEDMTELERAEQRAQWGAIVVHEAVPDGRAIDLDFQDADIHNLLRLLADVGGVNIVVPDEVRAKVTVRLKGVPWNQAMEVILESKGLGYRYRKSANVVRIASQRQLDLEDMQKIERAERGTQ